MRFQIRSKSSTSIKLGSLKIPFPEYITFFSDDIDKRAGSPIFNDNAFQNPYATTMNHAITKTNKLKKIFKNKTVLQLSDGTATTTQLILNQNPKQLTITETSKSQINITKNNLKMNYNNIDFAIGNWLYLNNKSLKTKLFDILICIPPFISINSNRRCYIDELICKSWKYLNNNGYLIFIQSSMALTEQTIYKLKQKGYSHISVVYGGKYVWKNDKKINNKNIERIETLYVIKAQLKKR